MRSTLTQDELQRSGLRPTLPPIAGAAQAGEVHPLLALQRTVGNRAVQRLLVQRDPVVPAAPVTTPEQQKAPTSPTPAPESAEQKKEAAAGTSPAFDKPWQAAFEALTLCNPKSILSADRPNVIWGIEWGGLIYKLGGKFYYTSPMEGSEGHVEVWDALTQVPKEAQNAIVGDYHTHGAKRLPGGGEDFSGYREDPLAKKIAAMKKEGPQGDIPETMKDVATRKEILDPKTYTAFLGTPTGRFSLFIPSQNLIFSFSPDPRLLPPDSKVPAAGYAH